MTDGDQFTNEVDRLRALIELGKSLQPPPPPDPLVQLRDVLTIARELAQPNTAAPAGDPPAPPLPADAPAYLAVLDRLAHTVERIIEKRAPATPTTAPPLARERPKIMVEEWLAPFVAYLPYLLEMAESGKAPELVAQTIAAQLEPEHLDALDPVLNREGYPDSIIAALPDLEARQAWAVPFLYALKAATQPAGEVELDPDAMDAGATKRRARPPARARRRKAKDEPASASG